MRAIYDLNVLLDVIPVYTPAKFVQAMAGK
jgi:hypothetical protein